MIDQRHLTCAGSTHRLFSLANAGHVLDSVNIMQLRAQPFVFAGLVALLGKSVESKRCPREPLVTAAAGTIQGIATQVPDSNVSVNKFLGIPFAQAPVRFEAPKALSTPFSSTFKATKLPPSCVSQISGNGKLMLRDG